LVVYDAGCCAWGRFDFGFVLIAIAMWQVAMAINHATITRQDKAAAHLHPP
jgi:hypothetical protein